MDSLKKISETSLETMIEERTQLSGKIKEDMIFCVVRKTEQRTCDSCPYDLPLDIFQEYFDLNS